MIIKTRSYMVTYKVTVLSEEHDINTTIDCNDDVFILDAAEEQGVELPYMSCRCMFNVCW
jgi:ferredoxin